MEQLRRGSVVVGGSRKKNTDADIKTPRDDNATGLL